MNLVSRTSQFDIPLAKLTEICDRISDFRMEVDEIYPCLIRWGLERGVKEQARKRMLILLLSIQEEYELPFDGLYAIVEKAWEYNGHVFIADVTHDVLREYSVNVSD